MRSEHQPCRDVREPGDHDADAGGTSEAFPPPHEQRVERERHQLADAQQFLDERGGN